MTKPAPAYGFYGRLSADFPSQIILDTTEVCNLACIHCPHPEFKKSPHYAGRTLGAELNAKVVEEVRDHGKGITQYIRYTGEGEPLIHPGIFPILDYTVRELRRDDESGESEVLASAWDQQTNVRSSRSFIAPHQKMVGKGAAKKREKILDLEDVYRNNQNVGAKAVRECIFAVMPRWFVEEAQTLCRQTLDKGEGVPLESRIAAMAKAFDGIGVSVARLEAKTRKRRGQWDAGDVAQLGIDYTSVTRDGVDADSLFPEQPITPSELGAEA